MKPKPIYHQELFYLSAYDDLGLTPKQGKEVYEFIEDIVKREDNPERIDKETILKEFFELYNPLELNWTLLIKDVLRQM